MSGRWDLHPKTSDTRQAYTVTLLPTKVSSFTARATDYKRVRVMAVNDLGARTSPEVVALLRQGLFVLEAAPSDQEAPTTGQAGDAATEEVDPGLRSGARTSGLPYFNPNLTG